MKDHEIRELVSELTTIAREYGQTQQLRERIAGIVRPAIERLQAENKAGTSMAFPTITVINALQARIDSLMLEYCPDAMTQEQRENWAAHQRPVEPGTQAAIDAAIRKP